MPSTSRIAYLLLSLLLFLPLTAPAQSLDYYANRLEKFGKGVPQEEVFVHMDNTCYFLDDTIFYKAYVTRGDNQLPTQVSRVLYVELLNNDGYLVERQILRLKNGQAHGSFCLADTLYWNPDLQLDEQGHAEVTFYNNSRTTFPTVSAEGLTDKGEVLSTDQSLND